MYNTNTQVYSMPEEKPKKNKKLGFLLFISILLIIIGILFQFVIIPNGELNEKKKAFVSISEQYLLEVKNRIDSKSFECSVDEETWIPIVDTPLGEGNIYYFMINTGTNGKDKLTKDVQNSTALLINPMVKSSFDNADLVGYIKWFRSGDGTNYKYYIMLSDVNNNGFSELLYEDSLATRFVSTDVKEELKPTFNSGKKYYRCRFK